MTPITCTIEVARPPEEAFAYVTDPTPSSSGSATSSAATWMGKARTASVPSASPLGVSDSPSGR
jgi:hypothetical protein